MSNNQQGRVLVLLLGDFHIPHRASQIFIKHKELLSGKKFNSILCTGNIGSKQIYEWLKTLTDNFHVVKGDFQDESISNFPSQKLVQIKGLNFGLIHGHQIIPWGDQEALCNKALAIGAEILVSGHTHQLKYSAHNGKHFLNPGSMTGAYSTTLADPIPSFMIVEIKKQESIVYSYSLIDDQIICEAAKLDRK